MTDHGENSGNARRNFLKVAGSAAAAALAAARGLLGQGAPRGSAGRMGPMRGAPPDRGMWITWYDLPEEGREDYFSWLHGTYLPGLLKRPGYLWAAHYASQDLEGGAENSKKYRHTDDPKVGKGYRYMLLIAARDAGVFGDPIPRQIHEALPEQGKKMLAMRAGERMDIFTETARRYGTAAPAYEEGLTGAPCIQVGSYDCELEYEQEMHAGYIQHRFPTMCATPSCVRVRKLNSVVGWAKHGILYEFASKAGFDRDYAPAVAHSPLGIGGHSVVPMLTHAPNGPNSAVRIWPPVPKA
ncbi:MAG: hypothetical protein ACRD4Y_05535 [Candidatus Acidiferrales bacterium]